ncbi:MAG TPA: hypothetical protein PLH27_04230 [bacterium]|nr:hypothetical protein [bacterium]HMY37221.1 hypothetical protein [bacterium]HMZ03854.1 hypothetical protein [bacterium]HNB08941.1 hypothetical protein [bacterium]HNB56186.1 hypothetical protein [bacterium]
MNAKSKPFEETGLAAHLLSQFTSMRRTTKKSVQTAPALANDFFSKDILTMLDFLQPLGTDIIATTASPPSHTIESFFNSSLSTRRAFRSAPVKTEPEWTPDEVISIDMVETKANPTTSPLAQEEAPARPRTIEEFINGLFQ